MAAAFREELVFNMESCYVGSDVLVYRRRDGDGAWKRGLEGEDFKCEDTSDSPPYPVSMSAMSILEGSKFAIMSACSFMSVRLATPKSAMPNLEAVVPAPV